MAFIQSKHAKYATKNPISRFLVKNFYATLFNLVTPLKLDSLLDVGCGEGMALKRLEPLLGRVRCHAIDLDPAEVSDARKNLPFCQVSVGSAYQIPLADNAVECVLCTEVLEHLEQPERALAEFYRVTRRYAILTVPREPIWRILNMARGAYWSDWGNTPGHLNHWSTTAFKDFAKTRFRVVEFRTPLPWTVLLCEKQ